MADFDRLVRQHKDAVYRQMVRACGGSHEDAEDALAVALVKAYRAIDDLHEPERFRAWLATIGRRVCGRLKHKAALQPVVALSEEFPDTASQIDGTFDSHVRDLVDQMPPGLKEVIVLRDLEGLSGEEAAAKLGISLAALKSRLHRARADLRSRIDACLDCA